VYDARVGGGFAPVVPPVECLGAGSCQGAGGVGAVFGVTGSVIARPGQNALGGPVVRPSGLLLLEKALRKCRLDKRRARRVACERVARRRYAARAAKVAGSRRGRGVVVRGRGVGVGVRGVVGGGR
jgi:hypothetical protein